MSSSLSSLGLGNVAQSWNIGSTNGTQSVGGSDPDGDGDRGHGGGRVGGHHGGGQLVSAILQALTQLGITGTNGTSSTGTSTDPSATSATATSTGSTSSLKNALGTFMRDLFATLQSQSTGQPPKGGSTSASRFQQDLQSLISSLGGTDSSGSGSTANNSTSQLSTDFQNLLGALGVQGNSTSLGSFLQALSQQIGTADSQGKLVSAQA